MRPKSQKGTKTRLKLIQTAVELFHKNGLHGTSIDDILARSETGKSQFYHYFTSKDDLIHEVLEYYLGIIEGSKGLATRPIETWDDLEMWFEFFLKAQEAFHCRRGCPIGAIASELSAEQEKIREDVFRIFCSIRSQVVLFLSRCQESRPSNERESPESLADFCLAVLQGAMLMAKVHGNAAPAREAIGHALRYLKNYTAEKLPV